MYSVVKTYVPRGFSALEASLEVSILPGLPSFSMSGVKEGQRHEMENRLRAALKNIGFRWPQGRIIVAIAPAWLQKSGSSFDLPAAVGILEASEQIVPRKKQEFAFMGELGLDACLRRVPGIFTCLELAAEQKKIIPVIPHANLAEALSFPHCPVALAADLDEALAYCEGHKEAVLPQPETAVKEISRSMGSELLASFSGDSLIILGLSLALAGWHPLFLLGSPGSGKSMLAELAVSLLPPLHEEDSYLLKKIYSVTENRTCETPGEGLRPFLSPHHSVTAMALTGGGCPVIPGLFSLAHKGVLFLDELNEYEAEKIEALREPLQNGEIALARGHDYVVLPADFLLIAAANPCRCGYFLEGNGRCHCTEREVRRYLSKVSGPIRDRFPIGLILKQLSGSALLETISQSEVKIKEAEQLCEKIKEAHEIAYSRCRKEGLKPVLNGRCRCSDLAELWAMPEDVLMLAKERAVHYHLSARSFRQVLSLARTSADLEGRTTVSRNDLDIAIYFKSNLEKNLSQARQAAERRFS